MDEALKTEIEAMLAPLVDGIKTLTEANQTVVGRLDTQDKAATETAETIKGMQGNIEKLQQAPPADDEPPADDDPTKALQSRIAELEKQATDDRSAAETARAETAQQKLRTDLGSLAEQHGMRGTAKDSFVNEHLGLFEQVEGDAIQVKGQQSPKDATKPYTAVEFIDGIRETHSHFWPVPKAGQFDNVPANERGAIEQLANLEGQELFDTISRPLAETTS